MRWIADQPETLRGSQRPVYSSIRDVASAQQPVIRRRFGERVNAFADGVDGAPNGIKRAKMVVVASAIWKGAVRGQVYHRYLVCHARRA